MSPAPVLRGALAVIPQDPLAVRGIHPIPKGPIERAQRILVKTKCAQSVARKSDLNRLVTRFGFGRRHLIRDRPEPCLNVGGVFHLQKEVRGLRQPAVAARQKALPIRQFEICHRGCPSSERSYNRCNQVSVSAGVCSRKRPARMAELLLMFWTVKSR